MTVKPLSLAELSVHSSRIVVALTGVALRLPGVAGNPAPAAGVELVVPATIAGPVAPAVPVGLGLPASPATAPSPSTRAVFAAFGVVPAASRVDGSPRSPT